MTKWLTKFLVLNSVTLHQLNLELSNDLINGLVCLAGHKSPKLLVALFVTPYLLPCLIPGYLVVSIVFTRKGEW